MIQEALAHVWDKAQAAREPHFIKCPGDPAHVHYLVMPNGAATEVRNTPEPRRLRVERLADIIELANNRADLDKSSEEEDGIDRRAVFYNEHEVVILFDTLNGLEYARLPLTATDEHHWFAQRRREPRLEPKELSDALRLLLRRCYDDAKLIKQVSSLRSRIDADAHTTSSRGGASWGRSVESAAEAGEAGMPDPYQTFMVRRYRNPDLNVREPVLFALDPDTDTLRWSVYPLEDSWIDYTERSVELVGDRLREGITAPVPVYRGAFQSLAQPPDSI